MKDEIVIIGAGISGLYTALLLESNFHVTILEARERIGGRALTLDGHDLGPSWVWPHHKLTLDLITKLQLSIFSQYNKGMALYQANTIEKFHQSLDSSMRIKGGVGAFVDAIKNQLKNTEIELSSAVRSLAMTTQGIKLQTQNKQYLAQYVINTLPPRLASKLTYTPPLPQNTLQTLQSIPTWMGYVIKVVVTYTEAFWRQEGLSGFAFCHYPPLSEVHDATLFNEAALFSFINAKHSSNTIKEDILHQLTTLFGPRAKNYKKIYILNWNQEDFTATKEDKIPLKTHPKYGYNISFFEEKLFFAGTESSFYEGGYIEGALASAHTAAEKLIEKSLYK